MTKPPVVNLEMADFWKDPYPALETLRAETPIAFIPQLDGIVMTLRDDIAECEKIIEVFSSHQPNGLMNKLMGHNMMRKDGEAHMAERKMIFPTVSPKTVKNHWKSLFEKDADRLLTSLAPNGQAELCRDYAMPLSGDALRQITGLLNLTPDEMDWCSQSMIDGIANYSGDRDVEKRCHEATGKIDTAIDEMLADGSGRDEDENFSLLKVSVDAGMPMESVRANIKLAISGGQNEPRDAIAGAVWALLKHPDQLQMALAGEVSWSQVFDEYSRWISPIGMSPRRVARSFTYHDIDFEPEQKVFFMFGSANRDETHFADSDRFDVTRDTAKSIAFGAGPHFCAGAWASRCLISEVALPMLFERLEGLRLDTQEVTFGGWAFRGPLKVPVVWG